MNTFLPENSQEVLSELRAVSQELFAEIGELADPEASFSPMKGEWSAKEVICHLRDAEQIFHQRMLQMLEEDEPFLRGYNPEELATERDYPSSNWAETRTSFQEARKLNLELLTNLEPVQWFKGAIHQERGHITIQDIAESLSDHSRIHIKQIRQNKAIYQAR